MDIFGISTNILHYLMRKVKFSAQDDKLKNWWIPPDYTAATLTVPSQPNENGSSSFADEISVSFLTA